MTSHPVVWRACSRSSASSTALPCPLRWKELVHISYFSSVCMEWCTENCEETTAVSALQLVTLYPWFHLFEALYLQRDTVTVYEIYDNRARVQQTECVINHVSFAWEPQTLNTPTNLSWWIGIVIIVFGPTKTSYICIWQITGPLIKVLVAT